MTLPRRAADGRWLTSGNPAGRPKRVEQIAELAQEHAPEAFAKIVELISHKDPKIALAASNAVLDRAFGRPFQAIQAQVEKLDIGRLWIEAVKMTNAPPTKTIRGEAVQQTRIVEGRDVPIAPPKTTSTAAPSDDGDDTTGEPW